MKELDRRDFEHIKQALPTAELLAQLAEEALELAHAALKLRRALDRTNPTPTTPADALDAVVEELADVGLLVDLLGTEQHRDAIDEIKHSKLIRWNKRLNDYAVKGGEGVMAEYIERGALIAEMEENIKTYWNEGSGGYYLAEDALNYSVKTAPTADVEEVRHAYFENVVNLGDEYCFGYCSECYTEHRAHNPTALRFDHRFCRWCGARMDGKKVD